MGSLCLDSGITPGEIGNFTGVPGGYRNPPGGQWALMGLSGKERKGPKCWPHLPPFPSPIRIRRRGRPPSLSLPPWSNPSWTRINWGGGILLLVGVGPPGAPLVGRLAPPLPSFIYRGRGHPMTHKLILEIFP